MEIFLFSAWKMLLISPMNLEKATEPERIKRQVISKSFVLENAGVLLP